MVLEKPAGVLVHPTLAGEKGTLVDWMIKRYPQIKKLNWPDKSRTGIVHRLDKDTSGLIILAKNPETLTKMQALFKNRQIVKIYTALVLGEIKPEQGRIEAAITRGDAGAQKVLDTTYSFSKENKIFVFWDSSSMGILIPLGG